MPTDFERGDRSWLGHPKRRNGAGLVDDMAFGDDKIMVVVERRRFVVSGLTGNDVDALKQAYRTGRLNHSALLANIVRKVPPEGSERAQADGSRRWILIHSLHLHKPVRSLSRMMDWRYGLPIIALVVSWAASHSERTLHGIVASLSLLAHPSLSTYPTVVSFVTLLAFAHELAHLAACYRFSGIVGSIGFFLDERSGGLSADISAMTRLPPAEVGLVYIAGPVVQALLSMTLLATAVPPLRIAGMASLALCLINLVPLRGTDGFHALAAFRRMKTRGKLGLGSI